MPVQADETAAHHRDSRAGRENLAQGQGVSEIAEQHGAPGTRNIKLARLGPVQISSFT